MKLQEIFDQLTYGEFSQLSIGGENAGVINDANYANVLSHINLGLTALFKRFNLKEGRVKLALITDQELYKLNSNYSVVATRVPLESRYILDSTNNRFVDDILKVEKVLTDGEATGKPIELSLNDSSDAYSVTTPSSLVLRVPKEMVTDGADLPEKLDTETLEIVYRANHPKIALPPAFCNACRVDVELPATHLEPLLYYVASRVNNPVGMTNEFHAGNSYYAKYEAACQELEGKGFQVDQGTANHRAVRNGWV